MQYAEMKNKRAKPLEGNLNEKPEWRLPSTPDPVLWQEARAYISGDDTYEVDGLSPQAAGGKKTGVNIRLFRQTAYYQARLHIKHGCKCLHPRLVELIIAKLANETNELKKKDKIPDYVEGAVIAALEKEPETAVRVCNNRFPNGRPGAPQKCPYHQ